MLPVSSHRALVKADLRNPRIPPLLNIGLSSLSLEFFFCLGKKNADSGCGGHDLHSHGKGRATNSQVGFQILIVTSYIKSDWFCCEKFFGGGHTHCCGLRGARGWAVITPPGDGILQIGLMLLICLILYAWLDRMLSATWSSHPYWWDANAAERLLLGSDWVSKQHLACRHLWIRLMASVESLHGQNCRKVKFF